MLQTQTVAGASCLSLQNPASVHSAGQEQGAHFMGGQGRVYGEAACETRIFPSHVKSQWELPRQQSPSQNRKEHRRAQ